MRAFGASGKGERVSETDRKEDVRLHTLTLHFRKASRSRDTCSLASFHPSRYHRHPTPDHPDLLGKELDLSSDAGPILADLFRGRLRQADKLRLHGEYPTRPV